MKKIIIAGRSNPELAKKIAKFSKNKLSDVEISDFADGEINVFIKNKLKNQDVIIVQSTCPPVNNNLIELLLLIDAAKRASANSLTLIMPYFGYSRKEKISRLGEPVSAKVFSTILENMGLKKIIAVDLHSPVIQGFFDVPLVNLQTTAIFAKEFKRIKIKDLMVISPDIGGVKRAKKYADLLNVPTAVIEKHRSINQKDKLQSLELIGDVKGKNALIVDDLISTGSTIIKAAELLKKKGAKKIYVIATHLVCPQKAIPKLENPLIEEILVSDSIPIPKKFPSKKLKILSLAKLISDEII